MPTLAPPVPLPIPRQGIRPDLDPTEVPADALRSAENWVRREGLFRVRQGFITFANSVAQRPTAYVQYAHQDTTTRLVKGTAIGWWRFNTATGAWVDITQAANLLTGGPTNLQVFRTFSKAGQTWLLGVNGLDAPKKWDGLTASYVNIAGAPPIARTMMVLFDRVILGNLSTGGTISPVAIDVSANKDFDAGWGAVLTAVLSETPGEIVAMQEMGFLQGAIYKDDAIYLAIAQGEAVPFRLQRVQGELAGPVSPLAVAALSDGVHAYLATDGSVQLFDGTGARSLGAHVQRHIAATMDLTRRARSWVAWDAERQWLWCVYPVVGGTDPTRGVIIEFPGINVYPIRWPTLTPVAGRKISIPSGLQIGALVGTIGEQTATIGEYDTTMRRFVIGHVTGQAHQDAGLSDAGAAIPSHFEPGLSDLGGRRAWKTVPEVEHFFRPTPVTQPVRVRLGTSDHGEDRTLEPDPTGTENALDLVTGGPYRTGHRRTARFFTMRVECDASQEVIYEGSEAGAVVRGPR